MTVWAIVKTEPGHEQKVASALTQAGHTVYMPLECRFPGPKRGRQRQSHTEVPLCPRRIFLATTGVIWATVAMPRHATGLVRDGELWPILIPGGQMALWREAVDGFNEIERRKHTRVTEKPVKRDWQHGFDSLAEVRERMMQP